LLDLRNGRKYFNLINSEKDASRTKAIEIFPYFSSNLAKKKDSNKADAILIASFYYETFRNEDKLRFLEQIDDTFQCEKILMEADISSQAVGLASSADFSLINLFLKADIIVKTVIISLIACSIYSWAIIFDKIKMFKKINLSSEEFEEKFWRSKSAETFYNSLPSDVEDPMTSLFKESMQGLIKSKSKTNLVEKMGGILEVGIEKQISKIEKGFTFLATVGSTAPFIGLFGTVWGIMNSFQSIAISRNTSLAIVAPGIAEALFATALGLLAAIPAVIAYNRFTNDSRKYSQKLESFSKRFISII
jgi:biopolymer transport protein TolQ